MLEFFKRFFALFSRAPADDDEVPVVKGAPWVAAVRACTGITEVPGGGNSPAIMAWRADIAKAFPEMEDYAEQYTADSIPWCGFGLGAAMCRVGIRPPFGDKDTDKFMWADSWSRWGVKLEKPIPGCIMTFTRNGGGHVGVLEKIEGNKLWVRGFNQSDAVNCSTRTLNNTFTAATWPFGYPIVAVESDTSNSVAAGKES